MPTMTEIDVVQQQITDYEKKLDTIERKIRLQTLSEKKRQSLEEEVEELKKKLSQHKQELTALRKENGKTTVVSVVIVGLMFLAYFIFWAP